MFISQQIKYKEEERSKFIQIGSEVKALTNQQILASLQITPSKLHTLSFLPARYREISSDKSISTPFLNLQKRQTRLLKDYNKARLCLETSSKGQTKYFLNLIFENMGEVDLQNFQTHTVSTKRVISKVVETSSRNFYQFYLLELLARKGWLLTQSIVQITILALKLDGLLETYRARPITSQEIISVIDLCLAPLYLTSGKELQSYWLPNFYYTMEYPQSEDIQTIKPAHFRSHASSFDQEYVEKFMQGLTENTAIQWCKRFGYSLGLLD